MLMKLVLAAAIGALGLGILAGCKQQKPPANQSHDSAPMSVDEAYLKENAAKPGVVTLPSGLQYRVIKQGAGKSAQSGEDMVTVTYKGSLVDGRVFDQTPAGQPASFPAGNLIPGWVEALSHMKEGDEWELVIPSALGYGAAGAGSDIPPNATLIFDMTLISVAPAQPQ